MPVNEYKRQSDIYFAPQKQLDNSQQELGNTITQATAEVTKVVYGVIEDNQKLQLQQDELATNQKLATELEQVRLQHKDNPMSEQYMEQAQSVYDTNFKELKDKTGWTQQKLLDDNYKVQKEKFLGEQTNWGITQQRTNLQNNFNLLKKQHEDMAYKYGMAGDYNGMVKTNQEMQTFINEQLTGLYSEGERQVEYENIKQNQITNFATGLIDNNPEQAGKYIETNKKLIPAKQYEYLRELAAKRKVMNYEWQKGQEKIAGNSSYISQLNKIYDGKATQADTFNYIEMHPELPQGQKEYLMKVVSGYERQQAKGQGTLSTIDKKLYYNNIHDDIMHIKKMGADLDFDFYNKTQNKLIDYEMKGIITKSEYQKFSTDLKDIANPILQSKNSKEYNASTGSWFWKDEVDYNQMIKDNLAQTNQFIKKLDDDGNVILNEKNSDYINLQFMYNANVPQNIESIMQAQFENQKTYTNINDWKEQLTPTQRKQIYQGAIDIVKRQYIVDNGLVSEKVVEQVGLNNALIITNEGLKQIKKADITKKSEIGVLNQLQLPLGGYVNIKK